MGIKSTIILDSVAYACYIFFFSFPASKRKIPWSGILFYMVSCPRQGLGFCLCLLNISEATAFPSSPTLEKEAGSVLQEDCNTQLQSQCKRRLSLQKVPGCSGLCPRTICDRSILCTRVVFHLWHQMCSAVDEGGECRNRNESKRNLGSPVKTLPG